MALTTVTGSLVSVNAIQGTLIADNAITAVHIATNAVSGTLIADNAVTAVHIAQNSITVTQLADDCVESDKIADGIITTNHLNKAMISSQTEVSAATGDFVLLGDTSDSNNLKKTPVSSIIGLASGTTINNNADNRIITGSGTANTLEGESGLTYDGSTLNITGKVHIGNTFTADGSYDNLVVGTGSGNEGMTIYGAANGASSIAFADPNDNDVGNIMYDHSSNFMKFVTNAGERMRITSGGSVGINETSPDFSGFGSNGGGLELDDVGANFTAVKVSHGATGNLYLAANTGAGYLWQYSNSPIIIGTNNAERIRIQDGTGRVGINATGIAYSSSEKLSLYNDNFGFGIKTTSTCAGLWHTGSSGTYLALAYGSGGAGGGGITFSGSSTSYTSASDYRLKENVDYAWDATTRLKELKPCRFNWISDDTNTLQDGFLAHEVSSVVPEAVTGEKDAVYTAEEAENAAGAEAGDIKMQALDNAKLVPLLVKTIQELEARITTLESS